MNSIHVTHEVLEGKTVISVVAESGWRSSEELKKSIEQTIFNAFGIKPVPWWEEMV